MTGSHSGSFAPDPSWPSILDLAAELWGPPNKPLSRRDDIRFGAKGSKSVKPSANAWHDHEANDGGGYKALWQLARPGQPLPSANGQTPPWLNIDVVYDYLNADGSLAFQVVRTITGRARFLQRRPNGSGGWAWKLDGVKRVPYHLPELVAAAPGSTIYICEGEKDVDRLRRHGLIASCNPGGAAEHKDKAKPYHGKWRDEFSKHLRGQHIRILPDNDAPGEDHALDVAGKLHGIAASVRIVQLPNLPPKGDVSDWLDAGGTVAELEQLAAQTKEAPKANSQTQPGPNPAQPPVPQDPVQDLVDEFNSHYFVVNENGRARIYARRHDAIQDRQFYERLTFDDFEKLFANRFIRVRKANGKFTRHNAAKLWIAHPDRRQFIGGIVFDPACRNSGPEILNLWDGFAVVPCSGSWAKLEAHIRDVICDEDPVVFAYLMDWMADLVQHPAHQGEVAVVLRGPEGCGKGTLAKALKYLLGQHGLAISNARHLTGQFNAHLRDVVFLFADEAFFASDRQHAGVLNSIITEPHLTIEGKYQNAVQMPNFLHVMMASNEQWVVPASLRSRRWLVLDVPSSKIGDHAYFAAIYQELESGGYAAMLHDLLHRDISASNLRAVPVTDALQEQRKRSIDTITAWWLDCLHRGYVFESRLGLEAHWQKWHVFLPTEVLFASYTRYCERHHERYPLSRELFGRWMASNGAKSCQKRNQAIGEHMVDVVTNRHSSRVAELVMSAKPHGYSIGLLVKARASIASFTGLGIEWK
jgi:hypothetical protein